MADDTGTLAQKNFCEIFNILKMVKEARASFSKPIGMIIEDVIGDDRIKQLFDQSGKHPDEYTNKPTGFIALDLGIITPETKNALLIAQSAERAFDLAEKAEAFAQQSSERITTKDKASGTDYVRFNDDIFKYVASDRDPANLQEAQATWMAAQMLLNNEIEAINGMIDNPGYVANPISRAENAAHGFKKVAADLYTQASEILKSEGHGNAAEQTSFIAQALNAKTSVNTKDAPTPSQTMKNLSWDYSIGSRDLAISLNDESYMDIQPFEKAINQLQDILPKPPSKLAPSKPQLSQKRTRA